MALLLAAGALWLRRRLPLREAVVVGVALAAALLAYAYHAGLDRLPPAGRAGWLTAAQEEYSHLWRDLDASAASAVAALGAPPSDGPTRLQAFERLQTLVHREEGFAITLLLLDPDGEASAWAGPGLLHEPDGDLPVAGLTFRAGYGAATLLAVRPVSTDRRPWRVVAGASFSTAALPFAARRLSAEEPVAWSLLPGGAPSPAAGALELTSPGAPRLVVEHLPRPLPGPEDARRRARRLAWGALGLGLLALVTMRSAGAWAAARLQESPRPLFSLAVPAVAAVACCDLAAGIAATAVPLLVLATLSGGAGLLQVLRGRSRIHPAVVGVGAAAILAGVAYLLPLLVGRLDLADPLAAAPQALAVRGTLLALTLGLLALASRRGQPRSPPTSAERWVWAGIALLLAAGTVIDLPVLALPLLAAGMAALAQWVRRAAPWGRPAAVAVVGLAVSLASAVAWETAHRAWLRHHAEADLLPGLAPPTRAETGALSGELGDFFRSRALEALVPRSPVGLDPQDLAYSLWRSSPLVRPAALSAVIVEAANGSRSSFSFGLPFGDDGEVDLAPGRGGELSLPGWEGSLLSGVGLVTLSGQTWGMVRYWLLLRPGFRLRGTLPAPHSPGLLRADPASLQPPEELLGGALYALYDRDGRAQVTPWRESPALPPVLAATRRAVVDTPQGTAWAYRSEAADGIEVVFVPLLTRAQALERVGAHALGTLLLVFVLLLLGIALALPRAAFREALQRAVRSYSKRLLIVYTALLLVPLLVVNLLLLQVLEERLIAEQRAGGEAALDSAQRVLGDYVVTLEPGFGIDTALDDSLLVWLSRVVHHELNLYWGASVYASSKRELFTAGLLPKRIPGEIFSRLSLLGYELSSRTSRVGDVGYLEIYAPLKVPGAPAQERLFLSMPLLAQQQEVRAEIASLRVKALLVTTTLFALLVAAGVRLSRNFTRPLMELVAGTQRIAAGATSLNLNPSELELSALVEAIDRMARSIAEARGKLLREKQVVERMVENINAGVVSVDRAGRALLRNRVAAELLGVEVGEELLAVLRRSSRFAAIAAFVERAGDEPSSSTLRLADRSGEEREWSMVWVPVPGGGEPAALLVVEDVSEVLRGQRLQAWAEMARIIAHEIKNPLTPIKLSAEHMREVYRRDPKHFGEVFESCTRNILAQVEELRQISSEFSTYSHIPRFDARPGDLVAAVREVAGAYASATQQGIEVSFSSDHDELPLRFDGRLLGRAVRNLVENALRAAGAGGSVEVSVTRSESRLAITVADSGPGVPAETLPRIFDPYFSTHAGGTGLGLPIARRIAEEHGGGITARNRPEGGLQVTIWLPAPHGLPGEGGEAGTGTKRER